MHTEIPPKSRRRFASVRYRSGRGVLAGVVAASLIGMCGLLYVALRPHESPQPAAPPQDIAELDTPTSTPEDEDPASALASQPALAPPPAEDAQPVESEASGDSDNRNSETNNRSLVDNATDNSGMNSGEMSASSLAIKPFDTSGGWSSQRIIALTTTGPTLIDLRVSVGGLSLEESSTHLLDSVGASLLDTATRSKPGSDEVESQPGGEMQQETSPELTWQALLETDLIQSGWLGNLMADDEQQEQLISMYDTQRDDKVSPDELRQFLSRGLSRRAPLQVTDAGAAPGASDISPWGLMDQNNDYLLDKTEWEASSQRILDSDRNGDMIVTSEEVSPEPSTEMQAGMMQSSLLQSKSMLIVEVDPDEADDELARLRSFAPVASRLMQHYTFLAELPRGQWPGFSDVRWSRLDKDASGALDRYEMRRLVDEPAHVTLYAKFPAATELGQVELHAQFSDEAHAAASEDWYQQADQGRVELPGLTLQLAVTDAFARPNQELLRSQLSAALNNPQIKVFIEQQLQLGDTAFELADADADKNLSEDEFKQVWMWISARQSSRMLARWMLAAQPWFQILDADGDGRASQLELESMGSRLAAWDENADGQLTSDETPLIVRFELNRSDSRLGNTLPSTQEGESPPELIAQDWFAAMDTDQDGAINEAEFLGDVGDFRALDANKDGNVRRSELYVPQDSY